MYRNLSALVIAQMFAQSSAPMVILIRGLIGAKLAPEVALATLPGLSGSLILQ